MALPSFDNEGIAMSLLLRKFLPFLDASQGRSSERATAHGFDSKW